jgi:hypothetical protein
MGSRHRFMLPPRLLAKYRYLPSGDQTGFQLRYSSSVTGTALPPSEGMVHSTRLALPGGRPQ